MDPATIDGYLAQTKLKHSKLNDTTWLVEPPGDEQIHPIIIRLTESWVLAGIMLELPNEEVLPALCATLLRMNAVMMMAKAGRTETGDLALSVEMPTSDLQWSEFQAGISALISYETALLK